MAQRPNTGGVRIRELADGTRAFELRFSAYGRREGVTLHERADCECGCGGSWTERAARNELANVRARIRAGAATRNRTSATDAAGDLRVPTFHEYASQWLERRSEGMLGDRPLSPNSRPTTSAGCAPPAPVLRSSAARRDRH
jgi:hypothetical protein